ncbi:MAG: MAPEG family protein [Pseudomonadota bacterium]
MITVTPIYAAILALLLIILSARVILRRRSVKVSVGDGGDQALVKRIRVQANCAEYAPFGVLLLLVVELAGATPLVVHELGLMLVAGRVLHAVGMGVTPQIPALRIIGMILTFTMLGLSAILMLYLMIV